MKQKNKSPKQEELITAYFPELVDLCVDGGKIVFLSKQGNSLRQDASVLIQGKRYVPPPKEYLPFDLPRVKAVLSWFEKDSDQKLFDDLEGYYPRFSYLDSGQLIIITIGTFLTYIQDHPDIYYLPVLELWASPERGKTKTGKAFTYVAYRGIHLVDLRETNLFRYSQNLRATLFFDFRDLWQTLERVGSGDILLLRFEKGARVARVLYPERGPFKDTVHFDVYGFTVIATNEPVHHILDTRCIPILMANRPGNYKNPTPEKAQELKERLTAWRGRVMNNSLPEIASISGLNGRLWDITKPLFQVCKLVSPNSLKVLEHALLGIAEERIRDQKESVDGQIVSAMFDLSPKDEVPEWNIKTQKILDRLNSNRPVKYPLTSQYLGKKLKGLGFRTRKVHGYSEILLDRQTLNTYVIQYGGSVSDESEVREGQSDNTLPPEKTLPTLPTLPYSTTTPEREVESGRVGSVGRECLRGEAYSETTNEHPEFLPEGEASHASDHAKQMAGDALRRGHEVCHDEAREWARRRDPYSLLAIESIENNLEHWESRDAEELGSLINKYFRKCGEVHQHYHGLNVR